MKTIFLSGMLLVGSGCAMAETPLRDLNSGFPMVTVESVEDWDERRKEIVGRIRLAAGIAVEPGKTALNTRRFGKVERDGFTVERVSFESLPGHLVTGSLWMPAGEFDVAIPAVLCPHGHFSDGRFFAQDDDNIARQLGNGAESDEVAARYPLQARCAQLARMGCAVLFYDMEGYADSIQLSGHRSGVRVGFDGLFSPKADALGLTVFGLQTWNSVRALDFLLTLPEVDPDRIAVTGASGGGTQTMVLAAIDERVAAAFPCVMVSEAMQGGCPCENAHHLRIGQGNIDIAAAIAPRPLGLTSADDWTIELEDKGYPDLLALYRMLGAEDKLSAGFNTEFKHNYNAVSRGQMYRFMNAHLGMKLAEVDLEERAFRPLSRHELAVWPEGDSPKEQGLSVGEEHELELVEEWARLSSEVLAPMYDPEDPRHSEVREQVRAAFGQMVGDAGISKGDVESIHPTNRMEEGIGVAELTLVHPSFGEELRAGIAIPSSGYNKKFVLWLTPAGSGAILDEDGLLTLQAVTLAASGYGVAAVDLPGGAEGLNVGAELTDGAPAWKRYAGFHYGYNDSLFARRVRAVLGLLAHAGAGQDFDAELIVVGLEGMGPVAAAVKALRPKVVERLAVDTQGFRFGMLDDHWDSGFLPMAAGLGDLEGLLALGAPGRLWVAGEGAGSEVLTGLWKGLGAEAALKFYPDDDWVEQSAAEWVTLGE